MKMEAILGWPMPTTVNEVRSFLGLVGLQEKLRRNSSKIASPLTRLTRKNVKFNWTDRCEGYFQLFKKLLAPAPVLTLLSGDEGYTVYCDASRVGLECVLIQ